METYLCIACNEKDVPKKTFVTTDENSANCFCVEFMRRIDYGYGDWVLFEV